MSVREQMLEAQQLIQKKQYAAAREILMGIDHPKAREWLKKLDDIAGPAQPQRSAGQRQRYIPEDWTPGHEPFNPYYIPIAIIVIIFGVSRVVRGLLRGTVELVVNASAFTLEDITLFLVVGAFLLLLFTGIPLATNWRRMGRPRWSTYTLFVTIPALIAFPLVFLIQAYFVDRMNVIITFVSMIGIAFVTGIGIAFPVGTIILQGSAYRKWNERDFRPMLYHQYPWDNALTGMFIFIGLCIVGVFMVYAETPPFKTYATSDATLNYPWHWGTASCSGAPDIECVHAISRRHRHNRFYHISFVKYSRGSWITSADVEEARRETFFTNNPDATVAEVVDFTWDGLPARYRDTIENDTEDGCTKRVRRVYVVYGDLAYHAVSGVCVQDWASYEPQLMAIVNTLDLH